MQENEPEYTSIHDADVHVCIFPHLKEFILLDFRDDDHPTFRVVSASELLTPQYYKEIEEEFTRLLHSDDVPFVSLMTLPQRMESFLRAKGLQRLNELLRNSQASKEAETPRVSVFFCSGPMITMGDDDVTAALDSFFEDGPPEAFVKEYGDTFRRLLEMERTSIRAQEMDELRRAVRGQSNQFFTLWQNRPSAANN